MNVESSIAQILEAEVTLSFSLAGGPGGQNVNKVATKALLKWDLGSSVALHEAWKQRFRERFPGQLSKDGVVVISCDSSRSQHQNREAALEKLAEMLRQTAKAPKKRIATKASAASKRKRLDSKKRHSEKKSNRRKIE